jgi:hypothetical protein
VGFDLALTGFGEDELLGLFADGTEGLTDPDDVPEPPAEPVTSRATCGCWAASAGVRGLHAAVEAVDAALGA